MLDPVVRARSARWITIAGLLFFMGQQAGARVSEEEAARLGRDLTPVGAQQAASDDGVIPAWAGGLTQPPSCYQGGGERYCDPYPADRPLYTVTSENLAQYEQWLTAGQRALFARYPETYKVPVYATRRGFANPDVQYAATLSNALRAELQANGEALVGAVAGVPFPIPANGHEVMWNHKTRYRGIGIRRWNNQFAVASSGEYDQTTFREDMLFNYSRPLGDPAALDDVLGYLMQVVTAPERLAGTVLLVHETLNPLDRDRRAWQYSPGQRRMRRAPNLGYDIPGVGANGLRTFDQVDVFNGAMDRYEWNLLDKRELLVPANSYRLHDGNLDYPDIIHRGHLNQALTRYELRRVWVVEAVLRPSTAHQYRRRRFYLDEDGWQIRVVDLYDGRNELWRVQEAHTVLAYDGLYQLPVCETVYDLQSNRYLVQALNNEEPETLAMPFEPDHFASGNAAKMAKQ